MYIYLFNLAKVTFILTKKQNIASDKDKFLLDTHKAEPLLALLQYSFVKLNSLLMCNVCSSHPVTQTVTRLSEQQPGQKYHTSK